MEKNRQTLTIKKIYDIEEAAEEFLLRTKGKNIIAFYAPMGTGKTTFIKAICKVLGIKDLVNSPTFAIANQYTTPEGENLYHIDCYRLESLEDALNIGIATYIEDNVRCFIEWPEVIEELLPEDTCHVTIEALSDGTRNIHFD